MIINWWRRRLASHDEAAAERLALLRWRAATSPHVSIVFVRKTYQHARRGTKAVIQREDTGQVQDAWFWWTRVKPGQLVVVGASSGWGPHSRRDNVLYVGSEHGGVGVYDRIDARTLRAADRHHRRTQGGGPA